MENVFNAEICLCIEISKYLIETYHHEPPIEVCKSTCAYPVQAQLALDDAFKYSFHPPWMLATQHLSSEVSYKQRYNHHYLLAYSEGRPANFLPASVPASVCRFYFLF